MKIQDAVKVLEQNAGEHLYDIFIPSLNKKVSFRPMTVSHQKTLSKMSLEENQVMFYKTLLALIYSLATEEIPLSKINEIDKTIILASIKKNNSISNDLTFNVVCPSCKKEIKETVDLDKFIQKISTYKLENKPLSVTIHDIKYDMMLGIPSVTDIVAYRDYCEERKQKIKDTFKNNPQEKEIEVQKFDILTQLEYTIMFIKELSFKGEKVEDFNTVDVSEKIKFIEGLNVSISNSVAKSVASEFIGIIDSLTHSVKCSCNPDQNIEVLSVEDFFYA